VTSQRPAPRSLSEPWPRILLVTGKGGVGKTTVSAALATAFAARGERVVIVETSGARVVPGLFGTSTEGYEPASVARGIHTISVTPRAALEDYVVQQIKIRRLYKLVFENRIMGPFIDAVPGLHDALQLGKVMDLERETLRGGPVWDRIIVDAPATGHGLTMLDAARAMMDMTRAGPMYEGLKQVHDVLDDPTKTGLVLVALPEEMPVNETLDLWGRLGKTRQQVQLCVLNQVRDRPAAAPDWSALRAALSQVPSAPLAECADIVDHWMRRVERQDGARQRLSAGLPVPVHDLPALPHRVESLADLTALGGALFAAPKKASS
jgi:anion-transporting  ArsA/GET3 family ATPase